MAANHNGLQLLLIRLWIRVRLRAAGIVRGGALRVPCDLSVEADLNDVMMNMSHAGLPIPVQDITPHFA